jgi:hypothetical protein
MDNEALPLAQCTPHWVAFTGNSDTPYAIGVLDVKQSPMVIELTAGPFVSLIIHEAILNRAPLPAGQLNSALPFKLEEIITKALEKNHKMRYQHASEIRTDLQRLKRDTESGKATVSSAAPVPVAQRTRLLAYASAAMLAIALVAAAFFLHSRKAHALTNKDTIVLSDFENKTGDAVFDDTLRQGLSVQLEQSPFLSMISESKVNQTLKLMRRLAGDRLTPEVTREVCQRTGSKAMLTGSIAGLGSQYVIGLKAVNCQNGDLLAEAAGAGCGQGSGTEGSGCCGSKFAEQAGRVTQHGAGIRYAARGCNHALARSTEGLQPGK